MEESQEINTKQQIIEDLLMDELSEWKDDACSTIDINNTEILFIIPAFLTDITYKFYGNFLSMILFVNLYFIYYF